ncbi:MAG TPA: sigma-70 family RNA polymerase sigma factor [Candidatus Dormibacteraeota bacterium]|nr:sigma-70 family RNA polymerase sigma factor [Candidatus Dormibacteraeota bacterium]
MARARGRLWRMGRGSKVDPGDGPGAATPGSAPETGDGRLISKATGGDREAFDLLVERHLPRVWAVVWRILRHNEDTEDVVQEVFLAAYQGLEGYRGEAKFSTWLHRIAVTRALNHLDRKEEKMRRAFRNLEDDSHLLEAAPEAAGSWIMRGSPSPLQALEADDLMRRLAACLSRLPAAWRAVLTLRDVDARSYEEIAALAGLALGTVRSRLARARVALRQCVAGEGP